MPAAFNPAAHAREWVEAEEGRLRLRQIKAAHEELDEQEAAKRQRATEQAEAARREAQERELARQRAAQEAEERRRREEAEAARQRRRRQSIQGAKGWSGFAWRLRPGFTLTPTLQAEVMRQIEAELAGLRLEELPQSEVNAIAEGVWERVCRPAAREQEDGRKRAEEEAEARRAAEARDWQERWAAREKEQQEAEETARKEREAQEQEARRRGREWEEERRRAARKRQLVAHGERYAREELEADETADPLLRLTLPARVRRELSAELDGDESEGEVEDLVDEILDDELS